MQVFVNAYNNGKVLGANTIDLIKSIGFAGVRTDIPNGLPTEQINAIVDEITSTEVVPIFVVGGWQWWRNNSVVEDRSTFPGIDSIVLDSIAVAHACNATPSKTCYIEVGNEPNFTGKYVDDPTSFARLVKAVNLAVALIEFPKIPHFISGGVSNINPGDGLDYVTNINNKLHPGGILGIHPYRLNKLPWDSLRGQAIGTIANSVRDLRPRYAITEGGWHTAPRQGRFPLCWMKESWTDNEIANFAVWEFDFWKASGAELYTWYQLNDGPNNTQEERFGIRYNTGGLKPVAYAIRDWITDNA